MMVILMLVLLAGCSENPVAPIPQDIQYDVHVVKTDLEDGSVWEHTYSFDRIDFNQWMTFCYINESEEGDIEYDERYTIRWRKGNRRPVSPWQSYGLTCGCTRCLVAPYGHCEG